MRRSVSMRLLQKLRIWWRQAPDDSVPPYPLTADEWAEVRKPVRKPTPRRWYLRLGAGRKFSVMRYRALGLG